jgi:magnesium transporter
MPFLGAAYLVTVRHGASLSYAPVRARVEREPELLALGPDRMACMRSFDFVVDQYLPSIRPSSATNCNKLEQGHLRRDVSRDVIVSSTTSNAN